MNYKVEGGLDFYAMLSVSKSQTSGEKDSSCCLISGNALDYTAVTLPCGHSFNYYDLYRDVCMQKSWSINNLSNNPLKYNEMRCPYCRYKYDKLLPFCKLDNVKCVYGVTTKKRRTFLPLFECQHCFSYGNKKGKQCKKLYTPQPSGIKRCVTHAKCKSATVVNQKQSICSAQLVSGKRKGELCGAKCSGEFCKRHTAK